MRQLIPLFALALAFLPATGCIEKGRIDLAGEKTSSLTTSLEGRFVMSDGSPAPNIEVTGYYGVQSLTTTTDNHGHFRFKSWNILGHPGEVHGKYTDAAGHVYYSVLSFRGVGEAFESSYVGEGVLEHMTAIIGRLTYPEGVRGEAWCEITAGERKLEVTAEADGQFRVELWPSAAQPIEVRAYAGERPLVMAQGTAGPVDIAVDTIELDLGEIRCERPE